MDTKRIGLATQTPLVRFRSTAAGDIPVALPSTIHEALTSNDYWQPTPGGVCRLVLDSARQWAQTGFMQEAHWFSLQALGPEELHFEDIPLILHNLRLRPEELQAYGRTKENLWAQIHGQAAPPLDVDAFRFYTRYNSFTADALLSLGSALDVVYVHDFQLLQVGGLIGPAAPAVFRWHGPFEPSRIPPYTLRFILRAIEQFDCVIVSTRRDLEGLIRAGFHGVARQVLPTIDASQWKTPTADEVAAFERHVDVKPEHRVVLCVARMDPMKRQDLLIDAVALLRAKHPDLRLVLVGNGSFSSSTGGIGLSKGTRWKDRLTAQVHELGMEDHVRFAHWIPEDALAAAYARADVVVLPSDVEGFGLTILEAWRYRRPVVVSAGAGSAEVVRPGHNGDLFEPENVPQLAERIARLLRDRDYAAAVGNAAAETLAHMRPAESANHERQILDDAVTRFRHPL